jgi:RimJ/RimL family protein N-acetyltransferase
MTDINLRENGEIYTDGELVGHVEWNDCTLLDISVEENKQANGIATEAVRQLLQKLREDGCREVNTTTVVSGAMETVLRRNGFEKSVVEEPIGTPARKAEDVDDAPTRERIEWQKALQ